MASRGVNKVILVGNLGADPEVRSTANGGTVTNVRIATSESWKDKQSGESQERTEWHRVVLFGKLGEIAGEYLSKGRQVYIEGSLRTNKYTDKDGIERYSTDIVASEMQMLGGGDGSRDGGGRRDHERAHGGGGNRGSGRQQEHDRGHYGNGGYREGDGGGPRQQPAGNERQQQPRGATQGRHSGGSITDDDIPFRAPISRRSWGVLS